jgi:hypothetical protein
MYDVLICGAILKHMRCSETYTSTGNHIEPMFNCEIETDAPECDDVDVETCRTNSQSKCDG